MKRLLMVISLALLGCLAFACERRSQEVGRESKTEIEADVTAIKALINKWVQLSNADDIDGIMSVFYAENSVLMPPNESIHKGKDAIRRSYQEYRTSNKDRYDGSTVEDVLVSGDLAVARGTDTGLSTPRSGGEAVQFNLKWLMVFDRQFDGTWKCLYEMWNANPTQTGSVEQELIKLENDWLQAFFKNDDAFADRFLADDYIGTDEHGNAKDKAQEIAEIKAGAHLSTSGVLDNIRVRVYGDAAVVTGRRVMKGLFQGKEYRSPYLWTDIFIQRGGRWQCVASHVSKAAGKIAPSAAIR